MIEARNCKLVGLLFVSITLLLSRSLAKEGGIAKLSQKGSVNCLGITCDRKCPLGTCSPRGSGQCCDDLANCSRGGCCGDSCLKNDDCKDGPCNKCVKVEGSNDKICGEKTRHRTKSKEPWTSCSSEKCLSGSCRPGTCAPRKDGECCDDLSQCSAGGCCGDLCTKSKDCKKGPCGSCEPVKGRKRERGGVKIKTCGGHQPLGLRIEVGSPSVSDDQSGIPGKPGVRPLGRRNRKQEGTEPMFIRKQVKEAEETENEPIFIDALF